MFSPFASVTAAVPVQLAAGTVYMFGVYADDLKEVLGFSQSEIQAVGTAGNVGLWLLLIGGLVFDRLGPRATIRLGALMVLLGYGGVYLAASSSRGAPAGLVALCMFLAGTGSSWAYLASLLGNVKSFGPEERGRVLGILVCFFGCSAAVFTSVYEGFFSSSSSPGGVVNFLLLLALLAPAMELAGSLVITQAPAPAQPPRHYRRALALTLALLLFLLVASLAGAAGDVLATGCLLLVAGVLVGLPWGTGPLRGGRSREYGRLSPPATAAGVGPLVVVRTRAFWVLFVMFGTGVGTAVTTMNNLSNLAKSQGQDASAGEQAMILLAVGNALSRILTGFVLDTGVSLRAVLSTWLGVASASSLLLALGGAAAMAPGALLLGLVEGALFCTCPLALQALYGDRHYGANMGTLLFGPTLGLASLATMAGALYDSHAVGSSGSSGSSADENECYGDICYQASFLVMSAVCLAASAVGVVYGAALGTTTSPSSLAGRSGPSGPPGPPGLPGLVGEEELEEEDVELVVA